MENPDVELMNNFMIDMWNQYIKPQDLVYYLGDFSLNKPHERMAILNQLNGHKIIIRGNHDPGPLSLASAGFHEVYSWLGLHVKDMYNNRYNLLLVHDPRGHYYLDTMEKRWYNYTVCGHVHDLWTRNHNAFNVGVDVHAFKPLNIRQVMAEFIGEEIDIKRVRVNRRPSHAGPTSLKEIKLWK